MKILKDKLLHFGCSFIISLVFSVLFMLIGMSVFEISISSFSVAFAAGLGKEFADKINPNNHWDWYDVLADFIGSICGILIPVICLLIF